MAATAAITTGVETATGGPSTGVAVVLGLVVEVVVVVMKAVVVVALSVVVVVVVVVVAAAALVVVLLVVVLVLILGALLAVVVIIVVVMEGGVVVVAVALVVVVLVVVLVLLLGALLAVVVIIVVRFKHSVCPSLRVNPSLQLSHMAAPCLVQFPPVLAKPPRQLHRLAAKNARTRNTHTSASTYYLQMTESVSALVFEGID